MVLRTGLKGTRELRGKDSAVSALAVPSFLVSSAVEHETLKQVSECDQRAEPDGIAQEGHDVVDFTPHT